MIEAPLALPVSRSSRADRDVDAVLLEDASGEPLARGASNGTDVPGDTAAADDPSAFKDPSSTDVSGGGARDSETPAAVAVPVSLQVSAPFGEDGAQWQTTAPVAGKFSSAAEHPPPRPSWDAVAMFSKGSLLVGVASAPSLTRMRVCLLSVPQWRRGA